MIHWTWLIPVLYLGAAIGFMLAALCSAAKDRNEEQPGECPMCGRKIPIALEENHAVAERRE
jgi:prepilin signal peptidase PulO-like enzyme (type II secretory pathway)